MSASGKYVLAQGAKAVRRLEVIHKRLEPGMIEIALQAGLQPAMRVADFGCGVGCALAWFASYVGAEGHVTGIDISRDQLEQAKHRLEREGNTNFSLVEADATQVPLEDNSFDFVYSRYLLIHLTNPMAAIREMVRVLKPGGVLFIDDGDMTSMFSSPPSAVDEFARLYVELAKHRGVDYTLGRRLHSLMQQAGIEDLAVRIEQPGYLRGEEKWALAWSLEEAKEAIVSCGLHTPEEVEELIADAQRATEEDTFLFVMPRMTRAWGRKPLAMSLVR